ncbi:hypothetical protein [Halobaculum rubrum]|uniref:hypothetical protein n=1 Tax=Halobaculum rubrum TaxID=2872158 RepID=UPI001CEDB8C3|nr:hypothetical protein [Halobaculum rubrum]
MLEFSDLREITPEIETYDLGDVGEAYDRMIANEARFRVVLDRSRRVDRSPFVRAAAPIG